MNKQTEALKLALEALKQIDEAMPFPVAKLAQKVIREALAEQPAQQEEADVAICVNCLGTKRPHASDPEWKGRCDCKPPQPAQQQEPVAMYEDWYNPKSCGHCGMVGGHTKICRHYTTPPQRKPLTDEEICRIGAQVHGFLLCNEGQWGIEMARAIEAAHGIKEKA